MVTFPSLRKCAALATALTLLGLGGCEKTEPPTQSTSANAAAPASKPATPNSFDDVTAQLDAGGDLYLYLSTAQWLGKISNGIDTLHDAMLSGSATGSVQDRDQAEKGFALAKDVIQKSGIEEITGVGASSFNFAPGLYRNKFFAHHSADQGSGLIWSLYGKAPGPLTGLDFLPADTGVAGFGNFDLAQLLNFLRQEINQSGIPELKQALAQGETQFSGVSGLKLDDVLGSLNGSLGMVLTLDATSTISIPIANQPQTIPTPRLALLIAVKNDLIFKQVDKMAGGNPGVVKVDEPDLQMRTMPLPIIPSLNLRPTVAQWNGFLVIASDDQIIRDMIAVKKGAPGYKSTAEYTTLSAGLPDQGNSFGVVSQVFADTVHKFQTQMYAGQQFAAAPAGLMQSLTNGYQTPGHFMSVGAVLPTGWLTVSQGTQGSSQMLAPLAILPAAIAAGVLLPAMNAAHAASVMPSTSSP